MRTARATAKSSRPRRTLCNCRAVQARAAEVYAEYAKHYQRRFKWLRPDRVRAGTGERPPLRCRCSLEGSETCGQWDPAKDTKLDALAELLTKKHPNEKVIVFTQFADTVHYLEKQLKRGASRRWPA